TFASHRSATSVYELPGGDPHLHELLCPRWRRAHWPTLVVHETLALGPEDVTVVDGIPATTVARTLPALGAVPRPQPVERAGAPAIGRELTPIEDLAATVERLGRKGRRGVGVLRQILAVRAPDRAVTESDMEMRLLQVLRAHGLPEPVTQYEVRH